MISPTTADYAWDREKIRKALTDSYTYDPNVVRMMNCVNWPEYMDDGKGRLKPEMYEAFANLCADLVRAINVELPEFAIEYWGVFNEVDFRDETPWPDLGLVYNQTAVAMRAVDPTIKIGGPAFERPDLTENVEAFLKVAAPNIDFLDYHGYATGDRNDDQNVYDRADYFGGIAVEMQATVAKYTPKPVEIFMSEYNINWAGDDVRQHNEFSAVFDALMMTNLANTGLTGSLAWNDQDEWYGKCDPGPKWQCRPSAHVFHFFNTHFLGEIVTTNSANPELVRAYAVRNAEQTALALMNRSSEAQLVQVELDGWSHSPQATDTFNIYRVEGPGLSQETVTYQALRANGIALPKDTVAIILRLDSASASLTPLPATQQPTVTPLPTLTPTPTPEPTATAVNGAPAIVGTFEALAEKTIINLTEAGSADWAKWGEVQEFGNPTFLTRKAGVTHQISDFSIFGLKGATVWTDMPLLFNWQDGSPTEAADEDSSAPVILGNYGNGFRFTVAADTTPRTLQVYISTMGSGDGKLYAYLSDASMVPYSSVLPDWSTGVYTLRYQAQTPNQYLTVEWAGSSFAELSWESVVLYAATLSMDEPLAKVTGQVRTEQDQALAGVFLKTSEGQTTISGQDGQYAFTGLTTGTYTFKAESPFYTFEPALITVEVSAPNTLVLPPNQTFIAKPLPKLTGTTSVIEQPTEIDLSAAGIINWAKWGTSATTEFVQKVGKPAITYFKLNPSPDHWGGPVTDSLVTYRWNDGASVATSLGETSSLQNAATTVFGTGFEILVPIEAGASQVEMVVGIDGGTAGELTASAATFAPFVSIFDNREASQRATLIFAIPVKPEMAGQTLTLRWVMAGSSEAWKGIYLDAVAIK
jgi:xylan 1,4-beta-xylosidase